MDVLAAVVPSIGVTVLFVLGIRVLVQADRRERAARSVLEHDGPAGAGEVRGHGAAPETSGEVPGNSVEGDTRN